MIKNYIFGYGSLIEKESRNRSIGDVAAYPTKVNGYVRGWWARIPVSGLTTTFLGCVKSSSLDSYDSGSNSVNGVLFEVNEKQLLSLDERESGYNREEIDSNQIEDFTKVLKPNDKVWIYINDIENTHNFFELNKPSKQFPIVQSYVDICLNGCIQIQESYDAVYAQNYIQEFIKDTIFWSQFWVNDRIYPRRPFIYCPNAYRIDEYLKSFLSDPSLFEQIYFE